MADANDTENISPKTLLQQNLDFEFRGSAERKAYWDRIKSMLNSDSTEEFDAGDPISNILLSVERRSICQALRKINRSTMDNQSSSTGSTDSTSSKLPVTMKRTQPTTTNGSKKIKAANEWKRSTFVLKADHNGTVSFVQTSATATPSVPPQDLQGMDEQVVHLEGSSADRSEYTTLWIPD